MKKSPIVILLIGIAFYACKKNEFRVCNDLLAPCTGTQLGSYCLFGYKWGEQPQFEPNGIEAQGPQLPGGIITYSFQNGTEKVSAHNRKRVTTLSFDEKGTCAREEIERALIEYEKIGNFTFQAEEDDSNSSIRFFIADDEEANVGNANYQDEQCSEIAGNVVFNNGPISNCHNVYILALHEVGHALGLGHVDSDNIMQVGRAKNSFDGLQDGDIEGIIAIYGPK